MGQLIDKTNTNKIVCPYNIDDILYYVDTTWWIPDEPTEFYVYAIHITKAPKRSHIVLIDCEYNARAVVPLHKINECCFESYEEGMKYIESLKYKNK